MKSVEGLVLTFLGNSLWQIPVLLAAGSVGGRLLSRGPARFRHALWLAVLAASVLLPAASLLPRQPPASAHGPSPLASLSTGDQATGWPAWVSRGKAHAPGIPGGLAGCVAGVYGLSLAAHAVRLARAWRWTARLGRGARVVADLPEPAASVAARCREAFGLGPVPLACSSAVDGPVTLGAAAALRGS